MQIPDIDTLRAWITDDEVFDEVKKTMTRAETEGKMSELGLIILKGNINAQRALTLKPQMEKKLQEALAQLSAEMKTDCSVGQDALLDKLMSEVNSAARHVKTVIKDPTILNDVIDAKIAELVQKRKDVITGIQQANPKLDPVIEKKLVEIALTDLNLKSSQVAVILPKYLSTAGNLFELSRKPNPSMTELLDAIGHWETTFNLATQECKTAYAEFGGNDLQNINNWLVDLAKAQFKAKYGNEPVLTPQMRQQFKELYAELQYVQDHPLGGMDDKTTFCTYSEDFATGIGIRHYFQQADACVSAFEPDTLIREESAEGLSKVVGAYMNKAGNVALRHHYPLGKVIDQNLGSAFKDAYVQEFKKAEDNSQNESMVDYTQMFTSTVTDMNRRGITLILGHQVVSLAGNSGMEGDGVADIQQFFEQDGVAGINAARVLSGILHQSAAIGCTKALMISDEACGGLVSQVSSYALNLHVTRVQDCQYRLNVKYDLVPAMISSRSGDLVMLDPSSSRMSFEFTLDLAIQHTDKISHISFLPQARFHSELNPMSFTPREYTNLQALRDPATNTPYHNQILTCPGLAQDAHLKELLDVESDQLDQNAVFDYVKDKIITRQELNALYALGLNDMQIEQLSYGLDPDARLTKDLVQRLTGTDLPQRQQAFDELQLLCRKLVVDGWQEPQDFDINDLALFTVGGLTMNNADPRLSDLVITRNYIKASDHPELRTLVTNLASNSTQRVAFAKMRLATAVQEARRAMGIDLLKTLNGTFSEAEIADLKAHPDQERIRSLLENIVIRNEMDEAIHSLKAYTQVR